MEIKKLLDLAMCFWKLTLNMILKFGSDSKNLFNVIGEQSNIFGLRLDDT